MLKSKGDARRMIKQGAVKIDGDTVNDIYENIKPVPVEIARYDPNDNDGVFQINIFNLVFTF